jgi:hypothetical protein
VKGTIGLLKGNLISDTTNLLTLAAGASVASPMNLYGHTNEGWEESFVDGPVQLNIASTNKKVIPVGDAGIFAPITIEKANSNPASYVAQYFHEAFSDIFSIISPPLDHVSHVEYWKLSCHDAANDAKINLSWRPDSFVGATNMERNDLTLAHYVDFGFGTAWNQEGNQSDVLGDENYGYLGSDNYITSFSEFTLASKSKFNVLPVNDIAFSARETAGIVTLKWNPNTQWKYYLSRGRTPGNYNFLKLIPLQTGIYHDTLPESGEFFYRLMLVDQHGGTVFSPTVRISSKEDCVFSLYPNPCREILFINFSTPSSIGTLDLVNSQGQTLQTLSLAGRAINTIWLNKGKYYIRYRVKNKVVTKAFIRL